MWGLNWPVYTGAHHPWEEPVAEGSQAVSAYPNFTPIILKPKTSPYNRAFLPVCVSVFMRMLMILISRKKRKRWKEEVSRKENTSVVHRAGTRGSGEFDKSRRVRIFVRQFFTSTERPRTRGTRYEHFSSSRSERNRPRERRWNVRCVSVVTSRVEREKSLAISLNWRFDVDNAIGWSRFVTWESMTRFAWFTNFKFI